MQIFLMCFYVLDIWVQGKKGWQKVEIGKEKKKTSLVMQIHCEGRKATGISTAKFHDRQG